MGRLKGTVTMPSFVALRIAGTTAVPELAMQRIASTFWLASDSISLTCL